MMDDLVFSVDCIQLDEVQIRVGRSETNTWWWQVLYVGQVQLEGTTHDGEDVAFRKAQAHRDLWLEQELEQLKGFRP
jgi:hypothetical protein